MSGACEAGFIVLYADLVAVGEAAVVELGLGEVPFIGLAVKYAADQVARSVMRSAGCST